MPSSQIHGEILRTRTVEGATLTESTYSARSHLTTHEHANPYFCLVLAGEYQEVSGRRKYLCYPGSLVVHPNAQRDTHCAEADSQALRDLASRETVSKKPQHLILAPAQWPM